MDPLLRIIMWLAILGIIYLIVRIIQIKKPEPKVKMFNTWWSFAGVVVGLIIAVFTSFAPLPLSAVMGMLAINGILFSVIGYFLGSIIGWGYNKFKK